MPTKRRQPHLPGVWETLAERTERVRREFLDRRSLRKGEKLPKKK